MDAISDPIGVVSAENRLVYANTAYRTLFDHVPDGVIGHECFSAHPNPSGGPCDTRPVSAAIRSRSPAFVQSERPQRPRRNAPNAMITASTVERGADGSAAPIHQVFQRWTYPVVAPVGTIGEVVEMIKDVTEQERLRAASRQAEALRAADRLKAELLGTVSHELRSPLAAIKGYAGTLLRHDGHLPHAERHEFLSAISQASDRLETIIDQLLLMSQLATGLITLQRAPVNLRQLAHEAVTGIERRLPRAAQNTGIGAQHRVVVLDHTALRPRTAATASATDPTSATGVQRDADPWQVPVVYGDRRLTARGQDQDKIHGFDVGADDYLTKPFNVDELLARVRAVLRRSQALGTGHEGAGAATGAGATLDLGPLHLDFVQHLAILDGQELALTPIEYRVLAYLAQNAGRVVTQDLLLEHVWGLEYVGESHLLQVNVNRQRRKLEPGGGVAAAAPQGQPAYPFIRTKVGIGYPLLRPPSPSAASAPSATPPLAMPEG